MQTGSFEKSKEKDDNKTKIKPSRIAETRTFDPVLLVAAGVTEEISPSFIGALTYLERITSEYVRHYIG